MQRLPKAENRKVIPRWRELNRTPGAELASAVRARRGSLKFELQQVESAWSRNPSVRTAFELVSAGSLGQVTDKVLEAAEYLARNDNAVERLRIFAKSLSEVQLPQSLEAEERIRGEIRRLKARVKEFPSYAILNVDLARRYASLGQNDKAEKFFRIAISLVPDNRFIVRSALRFFVHNRDLDKAIHLVRLHQKSQDPWLLSAVIATADLAGKHEFINVRRAKEIINSSLRPAQLSELASAVATLELSAGNNKRAKKLFAVSVINPNDNTVAQLKWADEEHQIGFKQELLETQLSFEARAIDAVAREQWSAAIENCELWRLDEPFSLRPVAIGGFLAAELLQNYKEALRITDNVSLRTQMMQVC